MSQLSEILQCPICEIEFAKTHPRRKYCSRKCALAADYRRNRNKYKLKRKKSYAKNKEKENARTMAWRKANKKACRKYQMKSKYGLTVSEYKKMTIEQNNVCYICGGTNPSGKTLFVDHNHQTGEIRKLLCSRCNWYVGLVETGPKIFEDIVQYIEEQNNESIKRDPLRHTG